MVMQVKSKEEIFLQAYPHPLALSCRLKGPVALQRPNIAAVWGSDWLPIVISV